MSHAHLKSDYAGLKRYPVTLGQAVCSALERKIVSLNEQIREIELSPTEKDRKRYLKRVISNLESQLLDARNQDL